MDEYDYILDKNGVSMLNRKWVSYFMNVAFMLIVLGVSSAHAAIEWQWTNPTPQGNALNGVVYNGTNQYVAVGDFGTVMTSADSYTWVNGASGMTNALNDVVWNGTQYLAVGDFGTVLRSTDGLTWTASTAGNTIAILNAVIWDGTQYVAVGQLGEILTSVDGITWVTQNTGTNLNFNDIVWTGTQYVVVGELGAVFTSLNATTWVQQTSPLTSNLNGVAWNGTLLVAVGASGATMSSPDGITWTSIAWTTFGIPLDDVAWDGTKFIAVSGSSYYSSIDGNWGGAAYNGDIRSTTHAIYPALGSWISVGSGGRIYTSLDGVNWTARFSGMKDSVEGLANNGTVAVALGQKCNFMTTADGVTWTTYASAMPASNSCTDIVWASTTNQFVALTSSGSTTGNIYISPDGINWTLVSTTGPTIYGSSIAYSPTAGYVAVGSPDFVTGEIWSSTDAMTWTKQTVPNALNDVAWVNNQFIAVGNNGAIHTSADGITWTTQTSGSAAHLYAVGGNGSIYLATGSSNTVLSSADGISWQPQTIAAPAFTLWNGGLVWTGNQFMLSGADNGDAKMMSSADGITWASNNLITNTFLGALDVFAGKVLAGGSLGTLISGTNIDVVTTITAGATEVTEGGATDGFDMVLTSAPSADVTITLSTDPEVTFTPVQMIFTPLNWNTPQTTTITAVDDAVPEPTKNIVLTPSVVSTDTRYHALVVPDIAVTVFDNDTPAVNITPTGGSTSVIEGGATDTYDVALATAPTANVNISLSIVSAQVTTDVYTLTFTPANWNLPQTVTVTAVDDAIVEGAHSDSITHTVASTDLNYNALAAPALSSITIVDNDAGSVLITESGGSTDIAEGGVTDSFDVVLGLQPSADVRVSLNPDFNNQCTASASPLTFTPANWNTPQTVTFTAVDDGIVEGAHTCAITITPRSSTAGYNLIAVPNVVINVTDNDFLGVTLSESGGSTDVTEGGNTDTYDVFLNSQPQLNVTVNIVPNAQVTTNVSMLTFTPANWNAPQTVTVTAVDDGVQEGTHTGVVSHNITSTDPGYAGFAVADVAVNITDNLAPVITLVGSTPMTITVGDAFTDPGVTIADDTDVGLVATVTGAVDTSKVASYTLKYDVSDAAGNAAVQVIRVVDVVAAGTTVTTTDPYVSESSGGGGGCAAPVQSVAQGLGLIPMLLMIFAGLGLVRRKEDESD